MPRQQSEPNELIAHLELYNDRARKLNESDFLRVFSEGKSTFRMLERPFRVVRDAGPEEDSMEAFVLTFRLFVQDRDGLSFRRMASFYDRIPVSQGLKDEVTEICQQVNKYLDGAAPLVVHEESIFRRRLLDVWMNGELAHVNVEHRTQLDVWTVKDDIRAFFQYEFEMVMTRLTQVVAALAEVNRRAIEELRAQKKSSTLIHLDG